VKTALKSVDFWLLFMAHGVYMLWDVQLQTATVSLQL